MVDIRVPSPNSLKAEISCPPIHKSLLPLELQVQWSIMSTQVCRVVEMMRSACCQTIRSRSCLRKAVLAHVAFSGLCVPGAPVIHRRAYSLESLSSGPGRPTLGPSPQQHCAERTSPSSALTHRNLSAVAVQVKQLFRVLLDAVAYRVGL